MVVACPLGTGYDQSNPFPPGLVENEIEIPSSKIPLGAYDLKGIHSCMTELYHRIIADRRWPDVGPNYLWWLAAFSCETLGKLLNYWVTQFPYQVNEGNNSHLV